MYGLALSVYPLPHPLTPSLPVPPLTEQRRIVAEVERRLSTLDRLELSVDFNLARAERLRQAILRRAFEGKLAPQGTTDESANAPKLALRGTG